MASFQEMYHRLFNAATDAINILQTAQKEAEEMFVEKEDAKITLLPSSGEGEDNQF